MDSPRLFPARAQLLFLPGSDQIPCSAALIIVLWQHFHPMTGRTQDTSSSPWGREGPGLLPPVSALVWAGREWGEQEGHDTEALLCSLGHKGLTANVQSCGRGPGLLSALDGPGREGLGQVGGFLTPSPLLFS